MKTNLHALLGLLTAVAMLLGCGGSQNAAVPQSVGAQSKARKASTYSGDLLYAITLDGVDMFSYPDGTLLNSFFPPSSIPTGLCGDENGDVFVTAETVSSSQGYVYEYAHGSATPILTLQDGSRSNPYLPRSCNVDPTTGNLAVVNDVYLHDTNNLAIFPNGQAPPTYYTIPTFDEFFFCAYDDSGDLFVDGEPAITGDSLLAELPNGGTSFINVNIEKKAVGFYRPWSLQWVSGNLSLSGSRGGAHNKARDRVFLISISGTSGKVIGTTDFRGGFARTWIQGNTILAPGTTKYNRKIGFWNYPGGGKPYKVLSDPQQVGSLLVSVAPSR